MLVLAAFRVSPIWVHHLAGPFARLRRMSAAEDHEVIGVVDDDRFVRLSFPRLPPMLQEPVHVQVG